MVLIGVFMWYFMCLALAGLLNLVMRRKFFNGPYLFLGFAAVSCLLQLAYGVASGPLESAILSCLYWFFPSLLAAWTGKRFVKKHPFSFPSVIWVREGKANPAPEAADTAAASL